MIRNSSRVLSQRRLRIMWIALPQERMVHPPGHFTLFSLDPESVHRRVFADHVFNRDRLARGALVGEAYRGVGTAADAGLPS